MSLDDDQGASSSPAIGGHPLHPMVVPFPIAFLVGALAVDIDFSATSDPHLGTGRILAAGCRLPGS